MVDILSRFTAWLPPINENSTPANMQAWLWAPLVATAYNILPWGRNGIPKDVQYNVGNHFDPATGTWHPPAGFIQMSCQIRCYEGLDLNQVITAKFCLVGTQDPSRQARAVVGKKGNYEGAVQRDSVYVPDGAIQTETDGNQVYQLKLYTTDDLIKIDANQAHTWWSGVCWG
jgi:hypothetical protein